MYRGTVLLASIVWAAHVTLVSGQEINRNTQLLVGVISGVGGLVIGVMIIILIIICRKRIKSQKESRTVPYRLHSASSWTVGHLSSRNGMEEAITHENQNYISSGSSFSLPRVKLGSANDNRNDSQTSRSNSDWRRSITDVAIARQTSYSDSESVSGNRPKSWRNSFPEDTYHGNVTNLYNHTCEQADIPTNTSNSFRRVTSLNDKMDFAKSEQKHSNFMSAWGESDIPSKRSKSERRLPARAPEMEYPMIYLQEGRTTANGNSSTSAEASFSRQIPRVKFSRTGNKN